MTEVLDVLESGDGPDPVADVIAMAAGALGVDGLALSLVTDGDLTELLWCSDGTTRYFEDLQLTLGEGPGPDTVRTGAMVWVPDLAGVRLARWRALAMEAPGLAARAVFCFPLSIGAIRVGVLTAVRRTPGAMSSQQTDDALILAHALTDACERWHVTVDEAFAAFRSYARANQRQLAQLAREIADRTFDTTAIPHPHHSTLRP
jgi:hypothetical protein